MGMQSLEDTICAPATVPGTGAISIVRLSGPEALAVAGRAVKVKGTPLTETEGYRLRYGTVLSDDGSVLDEVVVSVFRAPHSYTGEDSVEISCHSSRYIITALLGLLTAAGARLAEAGEFTRRAFLNGKMDLAQAEAVADVIASGSKAQHRVAMNQLRGGYSAQLRELRARMLEIYSLMELELDFSEEELEFADRSKLRSLLGEALGQCTRLADSFKEGNAIRSGVPVAIVGATNTGKSTLLNALLGDERAIVSPVPGTTRDTVEDCCIIGGVQFRFIDTAGIRETSDEIEKIGISRSYEKMCVASVVLALLDAGAPQEENKASVAEIASKLDFQSQKLIILLNKVDIIGDNINVNSVNEYVLSLDIKATAIAISAKAGFGLDELKKLLADSQKSLLSDSDQAVVTNLRHYEALREAAAALSRVIDGLGTSAAGSASSASYGAALPSDGTALYGPDRPHAAGSPLPSDLLVEDLRYALNSLGSITGEITTDELLGSIFSRFCVGK